MSQRSDPGLPFLARLEDYTYALNRQVEVIALVRSFRPMPVDEFDRKARPLII